MLGARWLVAFEAGADDTFVNLTSQIRKNLELQARLTKELMPPAGSVTNNVLIADPQYLRVIGHLARLLGPYPEARRAVAVGLRELDLAHPQLEAPALND
jgi:hypothetical protein